MHRIYLLALCAMLSGCFNAGLQPRAGRVLAPGQWSTGVTVDLLGLASGVASYRDEALPVTTPQRHPTIAVLNTAVTHPFALALLNTEVVAGVGVSPGLEVGLTAGFHEVSAGFRARVLDERRQDPVSLAAGATIAWRPYTGFPWLRLGADLGWHQGPGFLAAGLYLSQGPEAHILPWKDKELSQVRLVQSELRLHAALGAGVRRQDPETDEDTFLAVAQASGYRVLVAPEVPDSIKCEACNGQPSQEGWVMPPSWGGHLSTTLLWRGWFLE